MRRLVLVIVTALLMCGCAEKKYFNFNAYTLDSYPPAKEVTVYNNGRTPDLPYMKIGEIVVRGGDYGFRLKKTIQMAKNAGGDGVIVRGDRLGVNYKSNSMISFVIRFINEEESKAKTKDGSPKSDDSEFQEEEYIPEEYFMDFE